MHSSNRLFTIGNTPSNDNIAAQGLHKLLFNHKSRKKCRITSFESVNNGSLTQAELNKMVIYGSGSLSNFWKYTPEGFAIAMSFKCPENQKELLQDIYFIGSDLGLVKNDDSIAQEIVDALYSGGFTNVKLHCITQFEGASYGSLHVEVITDPGINEITGKRYKHIKPGYISAWLLNPELYKKLEDLQMNPVTNQDEIKKLIVEKGKCFVNHENPEIELNQKYNIFYPKSILEKGVKRSPESMRRKFPSEKTEVIHLMKKRLAYQQSYKNGEMTEALEASIHKLESSPTGDWQKIIREEKSEIGSKNNSIFVETSTTAKLYNALCDANLPKAREIIQKQEDKVEKKIEKKESPQKMAISLPLQDLDHLSIGKLELQQKKSNRSAIRIKREPQKQRLNDSSPNDTTLLANESKSSEDKIIITQDMKYYDAAKKLINAQIEIYNDYLDTIGCLAGLFRRRIFIKTSKRDKLELLLKSENYVKMKTLVDEYMDEKNKEHEAVRITTMSGASATMDLLTLIHDRPDELELKAEELVVTNEKEQEQANKKTI